ncbi:allantoin permease [Salmonella enterica subsp. enterica]|nr:allantoin permease [Salmonella enterica subsp. enterica]
MEHQRELYQQRGYSEDLLPKTETQRNWKAFNYFTLWMGSVHNVPNYVMVGGFFILGLSTFNIMLAIIISALFIAAAMVMNGAAGSKYGVPFAMILRGSYGVRGALFPGLLRGGDRGNYVVRLAVLRGIAGISYFDWEDLARISDIRRRFQAVGSFTARANYFSNFLDY